MFCKSISSVIAKNLLLSPFTTRDQLRGVKKRINTTWSQSGFNTGPRCAIELRPVSEPRAHIYENPDIEKEKGQHFARVILDLRLSTTNL